MTADRRSVSTDALGTLGSVLTEEDPHTRDAIHLAVMCVTAGERLAPGASVGFREDVGYGIAYETGDHLGIVDPFIDRHVQKGEKFWMVVKPRTITSLRHVWDHPAFDESKYKTPAITRLQEFAGNISVSYSELIGGATDFLKEGSHMSNGSQFEGVSTYDGFWADYQVATGEQAIMETGWDTGKNLADKAKQDGWDESFFSCSC